jgi:hypothetical protein
MPMAMPRYTVTVTYKHDRTIQVAAKSEEEAIQKASERVGRTVLEVISCRAQRNLYSEE